MIKKKICSNREGFTLIEVIAVVAIISIFAVVAVVSVNKLLKNSKEETENVSLESVKKSAVAYANENYMSANYWVSQGGEKETFCVPVLDLVNTGYLKKDEIEGIHNKYVLIYRDSSNKTIINESFVDNEYCSGSLSGNLSTKLDKGKVTTSSISLQATCTSETGDVVDNTKIKDYTFVAYLGEKEFGTVTQKNNNYTFYNLNRLSDGNQYQFKAKCNFGSGVSSEWSNPPVTSNVGKTDVAFALSDVKREDSSLYKELTIDFSSEGVSDSGYYFKATSDGKSSVEVVSCDNEVSPSTCTGDKDEKIKKGFWYKVDSSEITLTVYSNSTIYVRVWDGERYSTNKSIQVTFPTNPYVVLSVYKSGYSTFSGEYYQENNEIVEYNISNWMQTPEIKWNIYGGYETKSRVYFSGQNNYSEFSNYSTSNSLKTCASSNCVVDTFDGSGMIEFGIEVVNVKTEKKTVIRIRVKIDNKAPSCLWSGESTIWTNNSRTIKISCSDDESGCNSSYSSKEWAYSSGATKTDNLSYVIKDNAGNSVTCSKTANVYVDKREPSCDWNGESETWTNSNRTIKISCSDSDSGCNSSYSSKTWTYSSGATKTDNLSYIIKDNAGNSVTCSKTANVYVDKQAPSKPTIENPSQEEWTNQNFSLTLSSSDSHSGIAYYQYTYSSSASETGSDHNSQWKTYSNSASTSFITTPFSAERNQYVYIRACDMAGNCSDKNSTMIKIDKTSPKVTLELINKATGETEQKLEKIGNETVLNYKNGEWTNQSPEVKITVSDISSTYFTINYNKANDYDNLNDYNSNWYVTRTWETGYEYNANHIETQYDGKHTDTSVEFIIGSGGKRQIRILVNDSVGNKTSFIINANLDYEQPTVPSDYGITDSQAWLGTSTDSGSGLYNYHFEAYKDGNLFTQGQGNENINNSTNPRIIVSLSRFDQEGSYDIYSYAIDRAGSASEVSRRILDVTKKNTVVTNSCGSGYTYSNGYCVKTVYTTCYNTYEIRSASQWQSGSCWVSYQSGWTHSGCINSGRAWYTGNGGQCILYYCRSSYSCSQTYYGNVYSTTTNKCPNGYTESGDLCYKLVSG